MVPDVTRFAGFCSPSRLISDATLSREDKLGGLSTWQTLLMRLQQADGESEALSRLAKEIEKALFRLSGQ